MKKDKPIIESIPRRSVYAKLQQFEHCAKESDFIEVTQWSNGEGWDINISSYGDKLFQLSWGELDAIKALIKKLNKGDE